MTVGIRYTRSIQATLEKKTNNYARDIVACRVWAIHPPPQQHPVELSLFTPASKKNITNDHRFDIPHTGMGKSLSHMLAMIGPDIPAEVKKVSNN